VFPLNAFKSLQTRSDIHPTSHSVGSGGPFQGVKIRGVHLTTRLRLVPPLRMHRRQRWVSRICKTVGKRYTGAADVRGTHLYWKAVSYSTGQEMPCLQFRPIAENQPLGRALQCLGDLRTQQNYSPSFSWRVPQNFCG